MGRGKKPGQSSALGAAPWPELLVGDWVEVTEDDDGFIPLLGEQAEVTAIFDGGRSIGVIAGRLSTSLSWDQGQRWQKVLPPEEGPVGVVARFLRSDGAPSAGLRTAHSYASRPAPQHALVLETGQGEWDGWLKGEAKDERTGALQDVVEAAWDVCFETDSSEGWQEGLRTSLAGIDPDLIGKAVALGELLCEADCMNDGFVLHTYTPDFELRLYSDEDRKGLEAIVELMEALGFTLELAPSR